MKAYTCYDECDEEIKGAPHGTKDEVLVWAERQFGELTLSVMIPAQFFFTEVPLTVYETTDGTYVVIAEEHQKLDLDDTPDGLSFERNDGDEDDEDDEDEPEPPAPMPPEEFF